MQKEKLLAGVFCMFECLLPQNQSKLSTLLILQDQIEGYHKMQKQEVLGNNFCLEMISRLVPQ